MLFNRRLLTTDISDYTDDLRLRLAHTATFQSTVYIYISKTIFNKLPFYSSALSVHVHSDAHLECPNY